MCKGQNMSVTLYNLTLRFGKKQAEQPSVICWGKKNGMEAAAELN